MRAPIYCKKISSKIHISFESIRFVRNLDLGNDLSVDGTDSVFVDSNGTLVSFSQFGKQILPKESYCIAKYVLL
jgi:archaellum component FlaF (FlaF/FlaG flagellin family)